MNIRGNYVCNLSSVLYQMHFPFSSPFLALCNDDANGNVPLGKSCNRYWNCQGGYPRLQRCPAQLVFDRHSSRCVVPPTEECDIPATPAPELEQGTDQVNFILSYLHNFI